MSYPIHPILRVARAKSLRVRAASTLEWASEDPILKVTDLGHNTDTNIIKLGDGKKKWSELTALNDGGGSEGGGSSELLEEIIVQIEALQRDVATKAEQETLQDFSDAMYEAINNLTEAHTNLAEMVMQPRRTSSKTTGSLAAEAAEQSSITLSKGYRLLNLTTDKACRIRLYSTQAQMTADIARPIGTDPTGNHGLIFEYVATAGGAFTCNPLVDGANMESSPSGSIPCNIQNRSDSTGTVTISLTYIPTEV